MNRKNVRIVKPYGVDVDGVGQDSSRVERATRRLVGHWMCAGAPGYGRSSTLSIFIFVYAGRALFLYEAFEWLRVFLTYWSLCSIIGQ